MMANLSSFDWQGQHHYETLARFWLVVTRKCFQAGKKNRTQAYPRNTSRNACRNDCCKIYAAMQRAFPPSKVQSVRNPSWAAQMLARTNWKTVLSLSRTRLELLIAAFTGSPAQRTNHWTTAAVVVCSSSWRKLGSVEWNALSGFGSRWHLHESPNKRFHLHQRDVVLALSTPLVRLHAYL